MGGLATVLQLLNGEVRGDVFHGNPIHHHDLIPDSVGEGGEEEWVSVRKAEQSPHARGRGQLVWR